MGDGGPKLEAGMRVCGDGATTEGEATLEEGMSGEGRFCRDMRCVFGTSGEIGCEILEMLGVEGTEGVVGIAGVDGTEGRCKSLDIRFETVFVGATDNPAL